MMKLFKKPKDKIPKSEILTEPKEPKTPPVSKCGKPLQLDNSRWEASIFEILNLNFGQISRSNNWSSIYI